MAVEVIEKNTPEKVYTGFGAWSPKGIHLDDHKRNWSKETVSALTSLIKKEELGK